MSGFTHDANIKKNKIKPTIIKIPPNLSNNHNLKLIEKIVSETPEKCFFSTLFNPGYLVRADGLSMGSVPISQIFDTSIITETMEAPPPTVKILDAKNVVQNVKVAVHTQPLNLSWMYEVES